MAVKPTIVDVDADLEMIEDDMGNDITYHQFVSKAVDPESGNITTDDNDIVVKAILERISMREVLASNNFLQVEDIKFHIRTSQLGVTPCQADTLTSGGVTFEVVTWSYDPTQSLVTIVGRKI